VLGQDAAQWQHVLAQAHRGRERPLCLCQSAGVAMYVARHRRFLVKRLPGTGQCHAPTCPCHQPDVGSAPLVVKLPETAVASQPRTVDLSVDFAWTVREGARSARPREPLAGALAAPAPAPAMTLRSLLMFLLVRSGLHRWSPAMAGRRNPVAIHSYLTTRSQGIRVGGVPLSQNLYVVKPFGISDRIAHSSPAPGRLRLPSPMPAAHTRMLMLGEYRRSELHGEGLMLWLKYLPDAPICVSPAVWQAARADGEPMLRAHLQQAPGSVRLMVAALIARGTGDARQVDAIAMVPMTAQWIPVAGIHVLPLARALVAQQRRFAAVLPIDKSKGDSAPSIWLLDAGARAVPLRVACASDIDRLHGRPGVSASASRWSCWVWRTDGPIPPLPPRR